MRGIAHTLAQVSRLSLPYFRSEDRWAGRGLLGAILAIELAQVGIAVLLNSWNARFYDALQHKNASAFGYELIVFCALAGTFILLAVYQLYLSQGLQIRWRQWMTNRLLGSWLKDSTPYRMQLSADCADNPDQRIAEDIKLFVSNTLSLGTGLLGAVVTLGSFIVILWGLSSAAPLTLFGHALGIPGYLVWIAIVYAVAGTAITHWIGRPLVDLDIEQQRREADFRAGLLRVRENAEQIALLKGEAAERRRLMAHFSQDQGQLDRDHGPPKAPDLLYGGIQPSPGHRSDLGCRSSLFYQRNQSRRPDADGIGLCAGRRSTIVFRQGLSAARPMEVHHRAARRLRAEHCERG